jgi:predicted nucleic acid-binding protein
VIGAAVVDASVALKRVVDEPDTGSALKLRENALHAPDFLLSECANALCTRVRRGMMTRSQAEARHAELSAAPIAWTATGDVTADAILPALDLVHLVYDCLYLALAVRQDMPLVTADRRLLALGAAVPRLSTLVIPLSAVR